MKRFTLFLFFMFYPVLAQAMTQGQQGFASVRQCVMQNDVNYCHTLLTPDSYPLFDRFSGYKLMPCLPTDFTYQTEETYPDKTIVKATMPAGKGNMYVIRLVFVPTPQGLKLDLPASLRRGMGENWQNKIQLSEQVYLMMKQNLGNKLNCDMLNSLITTK